jgi:hypothetical protein
VVRILENWKQKMMMILTMITEMMMMMMMMVVVVVAVIFQNLDYGARDDYVILVL